MKRLIMLFSFTFLLASCNSVGDNQNTSKESDSSTSEEITAANYESKRLISEDIKKINTGDSLEMVYEELGKPFKEWTTEFVYDEIDSAILRDEMASSILAVTEEDKEKYENFVILGEKAKEINKLKMLQYTYTHEENKSTALFWISPRTDTVVYSTQRSFIDKNGETDDTSSSVGVPKDESNSNDDNNTVEMPLLTYSIGDTVSFSSDDGETIEVTIDSVTKSSGDDYHVPEGNFYAKIDFTIKNTGSAPFDVSSHFFEFYDSEDIKSNMDSKDYFSETIQAGKVAKGSVYFDVISEGSSFEIFFADTSWTDEYQ